MKPSRAFFAWILPAIGLAAGLVGGWLAPVAQSRPAPAPVNPPGLADPAAPTLPSGSTNRERKDPPGGHQPSPTTTSTQRAASEPHDLLGILKLPSTLHRRHALKALFDHMTPAEFPRVLEALQNYRGILDSQAIGLLFRSWVVAAPDDAILHALDVPEDEGREDLIAAGMRAWGRKDPVAAREYAARLPEMARLTAISYIDSLSGLKTPVAAPRETLRQILAEPTVSAPKVRTLLLDWATRDPVAAAKEAAALTDPALRASLLDSMAFYWARKDVRGATQWIDSLPADIDHTALQVQVARVVAGFDSAAARDLAFKLPASSQRTYLILEIANRWVGSDPTAAAAMVREAAGTGNGLQFASFFRTWAATDPESAVRAFVEILPPLDQRQSKENGYWQSVANVLDPWTKKDPAAAATFAIDLPQPERYEVFSRVAGTWCQTDASAAGAWAQALPAGQARSEMLEQVSYAWGQYDSGKVTQWLNALPHDEGRNAAIEGFALASFNTDPDGALEWLRAAASQNEPADARVARVWGYWSDRNPAAAKTWLEHSTQLSDNERAALEKAHPSTQPQPQKSE